MKDWFGNTALLTAIERLNADAAQILMSDERVDVNVQNEDDTTPLMEAASSRHGRRRAGALETRKDPGNGENRLGMTELDREATKTPQRAEVVRELLKNPHADANAQDQYGNTATMWAVDRMNNHVLALVLARDPDLDATNAEGDTALRIAYRLCNFDAVKLLRDAGARLDNEYTDSVQGCTIAARPVGGGASVLS